MRRRLVGVVLALVAAVAAIWWWERGNDIAEPTSSSGTATERHDRDLSRAQLAQRAWLGQHGVADRAIAGIVIGDKGRIVGATVRLATNVAAHEERVVTDADGSFDFGARLAGRYIVAAEAPGFAAAALQLYLQDPRATPDHLVLVLHPCEAWVYGTIRDTGGGTIAHAHVALDVAAETSAGVDADDTGAFNLCVPVGQRIVRARADGYASETGYVMALGKIRHDFTLGPEATIVGQVIKGSDRTTVAHAIVSLTSRAGSDAAVETDDGGRFTFEGLTPGRYHLSASADGLGTERAVDVVATVGKQGEATLELSPTFTVSGKVVDPSARGIAGASVALLGPTWERPAGALSQGDGSFEIANVRPGSYDLIVGGEKPLKPDPANVSVTAANAKGLTLQVERPASVSGRVTRHGQPIEGVDVSASGARTRTDAEGKFMLVNLRPGTFRIYAESERLGAYTTGPQVTVAKGEQKRGLDIDIDLAGTISGSVVDQDGAPVSGVSVTFVLVGGSDSGRAMTGEDGHFLVRGLSGGGVYTCIVTPADGYSDGYRAAGATRLAPVAVADGTTHVDGVMIRIRIERLAIAGRVIDASGAPVADVKVMASHYGMTGSVTSDASGAFRIKDLGAGSYSVTARGVDGYVTLDKIAAGRNDVVLTLAGTGTVDVTVIGFADRPEVALSTDLDTLVPTIKGSVFHFDRVPAGHARAVAISATDNDNANVVVTANTATSVTLHARGFGAVAGTIRDAATHAPIAGAFCFADTGDASRGRSSRNAPSDAAGGFRLDHVRAGQGQLHCETETGLYEYRDVTVASGETTRIDIEGTVPRPRKRADPGIVIAVQLSEAVVGSVTTGGAADRAGVRVGDVVTKVGDGEEAQDAYVIASMVMYADGPELKLTVERDDKQLVLTLSLASP